jgi:hypothetical protein
MKNSMKILLITASVVICNGVEAADWLHRAAGRPANSGKRNRLSHYEREQSARLDCSGDNKKARISFQLSFDEAIIEGLDGHLIANEQSIIDIIAYAAGASLDGRSRVVQAERD